jgi:hypothetical protein
MMSTDRFAPRQAVSPAELARSGPLLAQQGTHVSPDALFVPANEESTVCRATPVANSRFHRLMQALAMQPSADGGSC